MDVGHVLKTHYNIILGTKPFCSKKSVHYFASDLALNKTIIINAMVNLVLHFIVPSQNIKC